MTRITINGGIFDRNNKWVIKITIELTQVENGRMNFVAFNNTSPFDVLFSRRMSSADRHCNLAENLQVATYLRRTKFNPAFLLQRYRTSVLHSYSLSMLDIEG